MMREDEREAKKEEIIRACEKWVKNHKGEDLLLTYESICELYEVLTGSAIEDLLK